MAVPIWGARLVLAAVFATAGLAKLNDREQSRHSIADFGVSEAFAAPIAALLPLTELAVAAGLLVDGGAGFAAAGALVLLLSFSVAIGANLARGRTPDCRCFGQVHSAPVSWRSQARNTALAALGFAVVVGGPGTVPGSITGRVAGFAATAMAVGLVVRARRRAAPPEVAEEIEGLPVGSPAPPFSLPSLDGGEVSLRWLLGASRPVLLVFSDRGCSPCQALAPGLARWQRDHAGVVTIAVVERGGGDERRADAHGRANVLIDEGDRVASAYRAAGTPTALLVDADGRISSGLAAGAAAIEALLAGIVPGLRRVNPAGGSATGGRAEFGRRELLARAAAVWAGLTAAGLTLTPLARVSAASASRRGCPRPRVRCHGRCCPPGLVCRHGRCRCPSRESVRCGNRCCPPRFVCKREHTPRTGAPSLPLPEGHEAVRPHLRGPRSRSAQLRCLR